MSSMNRNFDIKASQKKLEEQSKQIKEFRKTVKTVRKDLSLSRRDLFVQSIPFLRSAFRSS